MATTTTTTATSTQILYERADIHKSCKSLETLLSVLNDYCEAAGAVVSLQKKLAKALRENAGSKATNDVAANALNASATIFEALSDIDSKFAKIADKEYDAISTEVKKWFKKLAKEEKTHDDKIFAANGRIKQAGQVYEKKSKKNARDAGDEHARYINLISSLGPEISQEKYNHTLLISQRHSSTTFSVAACVSRLADCEWSRSCEGVRRFAPTVGPLGEYRALCEGGWSGPMPSDLPDIDEKAEYHQDQQGTISLNGPPSNDEERYPPPTYRNVEPTDTTEQSTASRPPMLNLQDNDRQFSTPLGSPQGPRYPAAAPNTKSSPPSSFEPPRPLVDPNTGSVRSLSAFPAPPTHFPIPPLTPSQRQQPSFGQSSQSSSNSHVSFPTPVTRPPDGRVENHQDDSSTSHSPVSTPSSPQQRFNDAADYPKSATYNGHLSDHSDVRRPLPLRTSTLPPPVTESFADSDSKSSPHPGSANGAIPEDGADTDKSSSHPKSVPPSNGQMKGEYNEDREFGAGYKPAIAQGRAGEPLKPKPVERSDTTASNGSIVAAMRNRYSYNAGASSPPPKEIPVPRLPLSVPNLATRYQPTDGPSSPRIRATSPPPSRNLPSLDTFTQARQAEASFRDLGPQQRSPEGYHSPEPPRPRPEPSNRPSEPLLDDDTIRRQRRLEELEIQEKEQELRARELDIELKARELERQRDGVRMNMPMPMPRESYAGIGAGGGRAAGELERQRDNLLMRERERYDSTSTPRQSQYGASLNVPSSSRTPSDESMPQSQTNQMPESPQLNALHPAYCTCETCKYASKGTRPGEKSKGGWMRRLSMPIVAGLDVKRNSNTLKGMSLDGKKNASTTMLAVNTREDGRVVGGGRRSYDASTGISNRSVTNLGRR